MKIIKNFNSVFADSMRKFVDFKKAGALAYEQGAKELASFDRFVSEYTLKQPVITDTLAKHYLNSLSDLTVKTRYNRMCVLRQFSAFHHLCYPKSTILTETGIKKQQPVRFIVLNDDDVAELMAAANILKSVSHYAKAMKTLIGLVYCAALRISEALALNIDDYDPDNAIIFVRSGKFRKQRYIPLAASTQAAVSDYLASRHLPARVDANVPLFVGKLNHRLTYNCVYKAFNRLLDYTGMRDRCGAVRIHDLRHSFASNTLRQVVQADGDVYAMLPKLATFMGHVGFSSTQVYLHTDPGCLALAGDRFHDAFFKSTTL